MYGLCLVLVGVQCCPPVDINVRHTPVKTSVCLKGSTTHATWRRVISESDGCRLGLSVFVPFFSFSIFPDIFVVFFLS